MRINLKASFWIAFLLTLLGPLYFPKFHLFYFAPYLVLSYYKGSRLASILRSFFAGLWIDLLSSTFFGITALNYALVSFFLYGQKRNFFEDKFFTLPCMTAIFSFLSTIFSWVLLLLFGQKIALSMRWCVTDWLGMSFLDAFYALLFFSVPFQLTEKISKMKFFRKRRKEP